MSRVDSLPRVGEPFASPDDVLWRFLRLRERLGAPRRAHRVIDRGLVFGDRCQDCGASAETAWFDEYIRDPRTGVPGWRYLCAECGQPWPVDVAFLLRNTIQSSGRSGGLDSQMNTLALYSSLLSVLDLRQQRVYLLLYLYENIGSYAAVADEMNKRFPRSSPPQSARGPRAGGWSEWSVRQTINGARQKLRGALIERHLLRPSG